MELRAQVLEVRPQMNNGNCSAVKVKLRLVGEALDGIADHTVTLTVADPKAWGEFKLGGQVNIGVTEYVEPVPITTEVKTSEVKVEEKPKLLFPLKPEPPKSVLHK